MEVEERRKRQRAASERWKQANYEYYLNQKRSLSARPSYKAHRRQKYREKQITLRATEGYVPPVKGRPRIYSSSQARQRKRETARIWASTRRAREKISGEDKYLHDVNTPSSESSDRRCYTSRSSTPGRRERCRAYFEDRRWEEDPTDLSEQPPDSSRQVLLREDSDTGSRQIQLQPGCGEEGQESIHHTHGRHSEKDQHLG